MDRKTYLKEIRRLHPDKPGGNKDDFHAFMEKREKMKSDIFYQEDLFCKRHKINNNISDEFHTISERFEDGFKIIEKITFKKDNSLDREIIEKFKC